MTVAVQHHATAPLHEVGTGTGTVAVHHHATAPLHEVGAVTVAVQHHATAPLHDVGAVRHHGTAANIGTGTVTAHLHGTATKTSPAGRHAEVRVDRTKVHLVTRSEANGMARSSI